MSDGFNTKVGLLVLVPRGTLTQTNEFVAKLRGAIEAVEGAKVVFVRTSNFPLRIDELWPDNTWRKESASSIRAEHRRGRSQ